MPGSVIFLNGPSSSGKSTIARAAQALLPQPFWHYSIDHLLQARVLPRERIDSAEFRWSDLRANFFEGFHRTIPALVAARNDLIVEHIIETRQWMDRLIQLLAGHDVFFVGVHCPLDELVRREAARGNRRIGEAETDFSVAHQYCEYDLELDGTVAGDVSAQRLVAAWQDRKATGAFERMVARRKSERAA